MLDDAPEELSKGHGNTPCAEHLFTTNDNAEKLSKDKGEYFHSTVAKLLFLTQRARPDIGTGISFLCTRVQKPDEDDYKKLGRVLRYLKATKDLYLTLEASDQNELDIRWWVDASFACHPNMRSHTGGTMSLGKGGIYNTSKKQRLVACSSTEAELIGVHDIMPQLIWTRNFLEAQGYTVSSNVLNQDNKSTILLATNGRGSSSKRTRHINLRYFFVKDKCDKKVLTIQHCPTDKMLADFFTKPLHGSLFKWMRHHIMNIAPESKYSMEHRSVLEHDDVAEKDTGKPYLTALLKNVDRKAETLIR